MKLNPADLNREIAFRIQVVRAAQELATFVATGRLLFPRRGQPTASLKPPPPVEQSVAQQQVVAAFQVPGAREAERRAERGIRDRFVVGCLNFIPSSAIPTPACAVRALFRGLVPIRCECQTAMRLAVLKGVLDTFGDAAFDGLVAERGPGFCIGGGHDPVVYNALNLAGDSARLVAGDLVAFSNPEARDDSWRFENAVFVGNDPEGAPCFFAHPFGITTGAGIIAELERRRRPRSRARAFLATLIYPSFTYMSPLPAAGLYARFESEWSRSRLGRTR